MAKKDKIDLDADDFKFDDFDDFDDLSLDPPKDDRSPTRRVVDSAIKSAKGAVLSESFLKSFVRAALPKGYSDAIELGSDTLAKGRSLYNEATTTLRPGLKDFGRASKAILPKIEKHIPKALAEKIKALDTDEWKARSKKERDEDAVKTGLESIFAAQIQQQEALAEQASADEIVRDIKADKRNQAQVYYLKQIATLQNRLAGYQDNVLSKYQRKSLELQYRQLFVTRDLYDTVYTTNKTVVENLQAITKNTGLPDFVKQKTTEQGKKWLRDKMIGKVGESFQEYTANFRKNLTDKLESKTKEKLEQFKRGLGMAAGHLDQIASTDGPEGMGWDLAGNFIGSELAERLGVRLGKYLNPKLEKHQGIVKVGSKLQYGIANIPGLLDQFAKSNTDWSRQAKYGIDRPEVIDFLKGLLPRYNGNETAVANDGISTAKDAVAYSEQDSKSLTEIIPGFLSRILQSTEGIRTGTVPDRVVYNYDRNEFSSYQQTKEDVQRKFVGAKTMRSVDYSLEAMAKKVGPAGGLSESANKALKERFLKHMLTGGVYDPREFAKESFWDPNLDPEVVSELRKAFKDRYSIGSDGKIGDDVTALRRLNSDDEIFKTASRAMPQINKNLNAYASTGHREYLRDLGLLYKNQNPEDQVDHDFLWRFYKNQNNGAINESERGPQGGGQGMPPGGLPPGTGPIGGSQAAGNGSPKGGALGENPFTVTAAIAPEQIDRVVEGLDSNTIKIIKAIQDCSVRTTLEQTNALVNEIGQLLQAGVMSAGGVPPSSPTGRRTLGGFLGKSFDTTVAFGKGAISKAGKLSVPLAKLMAKGAKWGAIGGGMAMLGAGLGSAAPLVLAAGGAYALFKKRAKKICDVYVQGQREPVLTAHKLLAGEYVDATTGTVLKTVADIKGPVKDSLGNFVITTEDLKNGLFDGAGKKISNKLGDFVSGAYGLLGKGIKGAFGVYMAPLKLGARVAGWGLRKVKMPFDVYVKGESEPRLLARLLNAKQYISKRTGKPITGYGQIDSAITDTSGNEILSVQDISKGLVDRWGKPIKGLIGKIVGAGFGLVTKTIGGALKLGVGMAKAGLATGLGALKLTGKLAKAPLSLLDALRGVSAEGGGKESKRTPDLLSKIYKLLDARLPGKKKGSLFDKDGNGLRDGSWQEMLSRKKTSKGGVKPSELKKVAEGEGGFGKLLMLAITGISGLVGKLKDWLDPKNWLAKLAKLIGMAKAGEEVDDLIDDFGDSDGSDDRKKSRKERRRGRRGPRAPRGGGRWGSKGGDAVKKVATRSLGRTVASTAGRTVANTVGRTAITSVGRTVAMNVGRVAVMSGAEALLGAGAAELGAAAIGTAGAGLGAAAGGLGAAAVAAAPAVIIAAIVGGVAYGAWKGYQAFKNRGGDLTDLRWIQYGFDPEDDDSTDKCAALEEFLEDHIKYGGPNGADFDGSVDFAELVATCEVDITNKEAADKWTRWFAYRFKPVYLRYATLVKSYNPELNVTRVDRLDDQHKGVFAKNSLVFSPACPYDTLDNPFNGDALKGRKEVQAKVDELVAKYPANKATATMSTVDSKGLYHSAVTKADKPKGVKLTAANHSTVNYLSANEFEKAKNQKTKLANGKLLWEDAKGRVIDELTAVRMRVYGLSELNALDVNALLALERLLAPNLKYSWFDNASLEMDPVGIYVNVAPSFNCDPMDEQHRAQWVYWYTNRFAPVFLTYASAVRKADKYATLQNAWKMLKPNDLYAVAKAVNAAETELNGDDVSVWLVASSPFPDQDPNTDSKSVQASLKSLEEKQSTSVMQELNVNAKGEAKPKANTTLFGNYNRQSGGGTYSGYGASQQGGQGYGALPTGGAPGAPTTLSGGRAVEHQGGGTGGDINSLPMPSGDGWANVKDLIVAAAKMAGVDPSLMATMCGIESGFRISVKAGTSSAKGLFQFVSGTWKDMLNRYGAKYGINPSTSPTDPRANALMAAEYIKENASYLEDKLGRQPNDNDLYMAHFLGGGGAVKLLSAPPSAIGERVNPDAAAANEGIFYDKGRPRTVAEIYQLIDQKVGKWGNTVGVAAREMQKGGASTVAIPSSSGMPEYAKGGADAKPLPPASGVSSFGESQYSGGESLAGVKQTSIMPIPGAPAAGPVTAPVQAAAQSKASASKAVAQDAAVDYVQTQAIAKSTVAATQASKQTAIQKQQYVDANGLASQTLLVNQSMDNTLKAILESVKGITSSKGVTSASTKDSAVGPSGSMKIEHRRNDKMPISMDSK